MAAVKYLVCSTDTHTTFPVGYKWTEVPYATRSCVLEKLMNRLGQDGWSNYRYDDDDTKASLNFMRPAYQ